MIVAGRITDERGRPVRGARIYIVRAPVSMPDIAQLTDANGEFSVSAPVAGRYRIGIAASGHAPQERNVTVTEGQRTSLTVRLK